MAVIVSKLDTPVNVQATVTNGGSLAANTTYYYRIVAVTSPSSNMGYYGGWNWSNPSVEISATTTSTNKTISLSWTAIAGITSYEIFRTTVSGDYAYTDLHRINNKTLAYFYGATLTNSIVDDGTATLMAAILLENGYPLVTVEGGTESSPYTEEDIYQALIDAGYSTNTSRTSATVAQGIQNVQYWFNCWINIAGWLKFNNGTSIIHEGTISFSNGDYGWVMGSMTSAGSYGGASYFRKFIYQGSYNYPNNTIKAYNSYVKDMVSDYGGGSYTLANWALVYTGKIYMNNSVWLHPGLQFSGKAQGEIFNSTVRLSMNSSAKISTNNNFYTRNSYLVYAYYAIENTYTKNLKWDSTTYDILFHKDSTPCNIDAINPTFKYEPPRATALRSPENVNVNRKYELILNILDSRGTPVEDAVVKITDNLNNIITPEVSNSAGDVWISSGTATSGTETTIVDTTKNWETNSLADYIIEIYEGTGIGQEGSISSNSSNTITLKGSFLTIPNSTSKYRIVMLMKTHSYQGKAESPYYDTTTYIPLTLTIEKDGYSTYTSVFSPTQKMLETITLEDYQPPIYYQDKLEGDVETLVASGEIVEENLKGNVIEDNINGIIS